MTLAYLSTGEWDRLLADALGGRGLETVFQPIVDLRDGRVVGYEALSRFAGPDHLRPDHWFRAARARSVVARLDATTLQAALVWREALPKGCFMSVNLEPDSVGHPSVDAALRSAAPLDDLVIELTEHIPVEAGDYLEQKLLEYRKLGALIAVDDAGAGYAGLQSILRFRPAMLKLDRCLVAGIDQDDVKRALVQMLCVFAERIKAWILAEGIERAEEASTLRGLGVPLGQGYYLARPASPWAGLAEQPERLLGQRPLAAPGPGRVAPGPGGVAPKPSRVAPGPGGVATGRRLRVEVIDGEVAVLDEQGDRLGNLGAEQLIAALASTRGPAASLRPPVTILEKSAG